MPINRLGQHKWTVLGATFAFLCGGAAAVSLDRMFSSSPGVMSDLEGDQVCNRIMLDGHMAVLRGVLPEGDALTSVWYNADLSEGATEICRVTVDGKNTLAFSAQLFVGDASDWASRLRSKYAYSGAAKPVGRFGYGDAARVWKNGASVYLKCEEGDFNIFGGPPEKDESYFLSVTVRHTGESRVSGTKKLASLALLVTQMAYVADKSLPCTRSPSELDQLPEIEHN